MDDASLPRDLRMEVGIIHAQSFGPGGCHEIVIGGDERKAGNPEAVSSSLVRSAIASCTTSYPRKR